MWFGSDRLIIKYDGNKFTPYGPKGIEVRSIVVSKKGEIFFGTTKNGIIMYDGKIFSKYL